MIPARRKNTMNLITLDLGNNETASAGVISEKNGTFTAVTFSASKNFKTLAGARRWLARRGFATIER